MSVAATAAQVRASEAVPSTGVPPAPKDVKVAFVVSGAQAARSERVILTFVNAAGESANSPEFQFDVPANQVIQITNLFSDFVNAPNGPKGYNVYITKGGSLTETKQNTAVVQLGTPWTEPSTGLIAGAALPNNVAINSSYTTNLNSLNTPPVTGALVPPQSPSGAIVTNTGRSLSATATYMAAKLNVLNLGDTPGPAKN